MLDKYRSYGRFGGKMQLTLSAADAEFINGLMHAHHGADDEISLFTDKLWRLHMDQVEVFGYETALYEKNLSACKIND